MTAPGRLLRLTVFAFVMAGLVLPILAGFGQTLRAGFGVFPALGKHSASFSPFADLWVLPGFGTSLRLSIVTGLVSTLLALGLAAGIAPLMHGRSARWLALPLATPHAALAIGLGFLIAPSGWIARLLSPWATGWQIPPGLATVNDPWGGALILGMLIKEVPFLLLVILSALSQLPVRAHLRAGRSLGHSTASVWIKVILPQAYRLIRLPVFIVLTFSLSVVDMAIVLGPSNPPTLAVAVMRWFADPNPAMILPASAGALVQVALVGVLILTWLMAERFVRWLICIWLRRGGRGRGLAVVLRGAQMAGILLAVLATASLLALLIWSLAWRWSYPQALPVDWTWQNWRRAGWGGALVETLWLGLATGVMSLTLAVAWLEGEDRGHFPRARWAEALISLPLLLPQIGFLYGLNVLFLQIGISGGRLAVIWAHVLFVFPYVMIALSDPWRALDSRLLRVATSLGARPLRLLLTVKLPLLLRPLLTAAALGFAVSVAQYLPTLFMGGGRVATLTTEAVTLSSGSDRRIVGVYALMQVVLPFITYAGALFAPALIYRNRRGMGGAA